MKRGFTLIELIVVIIIVGILAALGLTQYSRTVEKSRITEAIVNISKMRTYAINYYMENGSFTNIGAADLGIGADFPSSCTSTNYFWYQTASHSNTGVQLDAERCTANGKTPQYQGASYEVYKTYYGDSGVDTGIKCWRGGSVVPCPP